jgi:hypothetical protein
MMIDEDELCAFLDWDYKAGFLQRAQIFCRGQPLRNAGFLDKTNFAVRLFEDQLNQFFAED